MLRITYIYNASSASVEERSDESLSNVCFGDERQITSGWGILHTAPRTILAVVRRLFIGKERLVESRLKLGAMRCDGSTLACGACTALTPPERPQFR